MRVNEAFGDTVNWDLVPDAAIERMSLLSGSNPVFGLNTLGGAISIRTKSGFTRHAHRQPVRSPLRDVRHAGRAG